jgi:hypothetical protein
LNADVMLSFLFFSSPVICQQFTVICPVIKIFLKKNHPKKGWLFECD